MSLTLKAARQMKELTQLEAANLLDISKYTLGNYERGRSSPDVNTLKKIEALYGVEYKDIIFLRTNYPLSVISSASH